MGDPEKYYPESEESINPLAGRQLSENGDYLCIQWWEHPVYVYKRVQPGEEVHPLVQQIEHNGCDYRLECIEDEKEHATCR